MILSNSAIFIWRKLILFLQVYREFQKDNEGYRTCYYNREEKKIWSMAKQGNIS